MRAAADGAQRQCSALKARLEAPVLAWSERGVPWQLGGRQQGKPRPRPTAEQVVHAKQRAESLLMLLRLVDEYVPACFVLGFAVRSCHWDGREEHSGVRARHVLMGAVIVLVHLCLGDESSVEYIQALLVALCTWNAWNDRLFGSCYSEEVNEAALSQLSAQLLRDPHLMTEEQASWAYVTMGAAVPGARDTTSHNVSAELRARCATHLRALVSGSTPTVPWMEYATPGPLPVQSTWPWPVETPVSLRMPLTGDLWRDLIVHVQRVLAQPSGRVTPAVLGMLQSLAGRRGAYEAAVANGNVAVFLQRNREPMRYRGPRPRRSTVYAEDRSRGARHPVG